MARSGAFLVLGGPPTTNQLAKVLARIGRVVLARSYREARKLLLKEGSWAGLVIEPHLKGRASGWDFVSEARARYPRARIMVYTRLDEPGSSRRALACGATFLRKDAWSSDRVAIREWALQASALRSAAMRIRLFGPQFAGGFSLTVAETDVLVRQCLGADLKRIAVARGTSYQTVQTQSRSVVRKLGVTNLDGGARLLMLAALEWDGGGSTGTVESVGAGHTCAMGGHRPDMQGADRSCKGDCGPARIRQWAAA